MLASPLSSISLANLLDLSVSDVKFRLDPLHSVLSVPTSQSAPVRLLHLSFRDFLVDAKKRDKSPFWIDEKKTHAELASKCIQLMSKPGCLKKDICNLQKPGRLRATIDDQTTDVLSNSYAFGIGSTIWRRAPIEFMMVDKFTSSFESIYFTGLKP